MEWLESFTRKQALPTYINDSARVVRVRNGHEGARNSWQDCNHLVSSILTMNNQCATDDRIHRDIRYHGKLIDGEPCNLKLQFPFFAFLFEAMINNGNDLVFLCSASI